MHTCTSLPSLGQVPYLILLLLFSVSAVSAKSKPCPQNNYVCLMTLCEKFDGATTDTGNYLYGTDQWGDDGSGGQCMTVDLDDDKTDAASFNATWVWENNTDLVHSFPNVGYESIQLPTKLSNIKSFTLNASWSVYPTDEYSATTDDDALNAIGTKADIALDMFLDNDETAAANASAANVEIMVWSAVWGGVWPIGYIDPPVGVPNYTVGGVTYQLFSGYNSDGRQQAVFSWVPVENQDSVNADVFELVNYLVENDSANVTDSMYLGLIQFGSETVHATKNITFEVKEAYMNLEVISARATPSTSSKGSSATSTSSGAANAMMPAITNFAFPAAMGLAAVMMG